MIRHLDKEYIEIERITKVPLGDFPDVDRMRELLKSQDFSNFEKRSDRLVQQMVFSSFKAGMVTTSFIEGSSSN